MPEDKSLSDDLKALIVEVLLLEDMIAADIETDAPLFGDGLGLDSIDALELGMELSKRYEISLSQDPEENRGHFYSVATLTAFIRQRISQRQETNHEK